MLRAMTVDVFLAMRYLPVIQQTLFLPFENLRVRLLSSLFRRRGEDKLQRNLGLFVPTFSREKR